MFQENPHIGWGEALQTIVSDGQRIRFNRKNDLCRQLDLMLKSGNPPLLAWVHILTLHHLHLAISRDDVDLGPRLQHMARTVADRIDEGVSLPESVRYYLYADTAQ